MRLYSSTVCVGLLVVFWCQGDKQPKTVSDFCSIAGPQIAKFKALSEEELAALTRPRKEAIASLRRNYKALCP
jgi:hypothetical protein